MRRRRRAAGIQTFINLKVKSTKCHNLATK